MNQDAEPIERRATGSLYAAALNNPQPDLWARLTGSPVLRPRSPSLASSLAIDRPDDGVMDTDAIDDGGGPCMLDSVVHLHELPEQYAYAYFERDKLPERVQTPAGAVVFNGFPCRPRIVHASQIVWRPVLGNDGLSGHRYDFIDDGEVQAHAEVFVSAKAIHRVALVHRMFTPVARASGLVDKASMLEFNSPSAHMQRLRCFLGAIPSGQFYIPVNELSTGSQLDMPIEIDPIHCRNPSACAAEAVWTRTKLELRAIAALSMAASCAHNTSEFARAGLS